MEYIFKGRTVPAFFFCEAREVFILLRRNSRHEFHYSFVEAPNEIRSVCRIIFSLVLPSFFLYETYTDPSFFVASFIPIRNSLRRMLQKYT